MTKGVLKTIKNSSHVPLMDHDGSGQVPSDLEQVGFLPRWMIWERSLWEKNETEEEPKETGISEDRVETHGRCRVLLPGISGGITDLLTCGGAMLLSIYMYSICVCVNKTNATKMA